MRQYKELNISVEEIVEDLDELNLDICLNLSLSENSFEFFREKMANIIRNRYRDYNGAYQCQYSQCLVTHNHSILFYKYCKLRVGNNGIFN